MSTQYFLIKNESDEELLHLDERSSKFQICVTKEFTDSPRFTAEEVVEVAMRLLQPTLYNVEDPKAFRDWII